jgi:hypothetical protein
VDIVRQAQKNYVAENYRFVYDIHGSSAVAAGNWKMGWCVAIA